MKAKFEKILKELKVGETNKIRLKKKSQHIDIWWEDKSKDFLNIKATKDIESYWILDTEALRHLIFLYPNFEKIN